MLKRPVLRYFGGKWRIAPWVISHFPPHRRYVEPFGGAASVLLQKQPAYNEVYNDLDSSVVNFFRVVRSPWQRAALQDALRLTPYSREEFADALPPADNPVESARRLCVRSYMGCGSSGLRRRKTGFRSEWQDPVKTQSQLICWETLPARLEDVAARLRMVMIENRDALELISLFDDSETLLYCDPPYEFSTRKKGGLKEYRHEMDDSQHAELLEILEKSRAMVVLGGYPGSMADELGWEHFDCKARSMNGGGRTERIWINPPASKRLEHHQAFVQLEMEGMTQ